MQRNSQAGEGRLQLLFWLVVFVLAGLAAWEFVPKRIQVAEFQDYLVDTAQMAARANEKQIRKNIVNKAKEMGLPLNTKTLSVQKVGGKIRIHAEYTMDLNFPLYTYAWQVDHDIDRPYFIF